jgi:hypothetical protein
MNSTTAQPLRRSARLAEKMRRLAPEATSPEKPNPTRKLHTPLSVLDILIKYAELVRGYEKRKALIALFSYFQENLDFIKSQKGSTELIKTYNEKLDLIKSYYRNDPEIQSL